MPLSSYDEYEFRCCPTCGVEYAAPKVFMEECRKNPSLYFHCPNGHSRHFSESEADKLRRERDRLQQQLAWKDDEITAKAKQIKRLEKRAAAGTCPCCSRSFTNMSQHMKTKHPEFVAENVVKLKRA